MIHPDTELKFKNSLVGQGVFATRFIPKGTLVWVLCDLDLRISPTQRANLDPSYHGIVDKYSYIDARGDFILCWDYGRYVNHSCNPAMLGLGETFEIAVRDIQPGEELTCEYGILNLLQPLDCQCGAENCRGGVQDFDSLNIYAQIDEQVKQLLPYVQQVEQPLMPFVKAADRQQLKQWIQGELETPSARHYYYVKK